MIIVTGGAGFIGCNLIRKINSFGDSNIIAVDSIKKNKKNINYIKFKDYFDKEEFISKIENNKIQSNIKCIIHLGACSDTTETNWDYLKYNNIIYSKLLYKFSLSKNSKFLYASSAAIYGNPSGNKIFKKLNYKPLNLYGKSKLDLDKFFFNKNKYKVTGLRYFNVYGDFEKHKNKMRSPVSKFYDQLKKENKVNLFEFKKKNEPYRDFIYVKDAVDMTLYLMNKKKYGLYNIGTGKPESFMKIAKILINKMNKGTIRLIKFPFHLKNKYQFFTKANISEIRKLGYKKKMFDIEDGINSYIKNLQKLKAK